MKTYIFTALILLLAILPGSAGGADYLRETNGYDLWCRYKIGAVAERLPHRENRTQDKEQGGFVQLALLGSGRVYDDWSFLSEGRAFLSGSQLSSTFTDQDAGRVARTTDTSSYLQLRQFWVRYHGITDYPGEHLTLGLQRIRSASSLWWDSDLEAVVWRFSGTRLRFQAGIGERFDPYRTGSELNAVDKNKLRFFTESIIDWKPYHEITFRGMYSRQNSHDKAGDVYSSAPEGINGEWLWYGLGLSSNWIKRRNHQSPFAYNLEWIGLTGQSDFTREDGTLLENHTISAWAVDAGVRYDFQTMPTSFGLSFTFGSGGFDNNVSNLFVQTGLQSNRNRYVGNGQYLYRFNDALRPDLTNLIQESLFFSHTFQDTFLLAGALSGYQRDENRLPIYMNSEPLNMNRLSSDVGSGVDLSLRYDVQTTIFSVPLKFIRLRSSAFFPGGAFDDDADDTVYRVVLELVGGAIL